MNWKLIAGLSLAGILMGFASIYGLPTKMEQFLWLPFLLLSAWLIARNTDSRPFLHGFITGLINCLWEVIIRLQLSAKYLATHDHEAKLFAKMQVQNGTPLNVSIVMTTVIVGLMTALVLGVLAKMTVGFLKKIE